jgi:hypothetical protein
MSLISMTASVETHPGMPQKHARENRLGRPTLRVKPWNLDIRLITGRLSRSILYSLRTKARVFGQTIPEGGRVPILVPAPDRGRSRPRRRTARRVGNYSLPWWNKVFSRAPVLLIRWRKNSRASIAPGVGLGASRTSTQMGKAKSDLGVFGTGVG